MKKVFFGIVFLYGISVFSQSVEGKWTTYDDKTGEKKSIVEIFSRGGKIYGKIVKKLTNSNNTICTKCEGTKRNKPLIGLEIIENLSLEDGLYTGGTITDPESGKVYKCYLELESNNKLKVRGYIGFSLLGRTQYWLRTK